MANVATAQKIHEYFGQLSEVEKEVNRIVVGQNATIKGLLRGLLCNGNVFIEGVPGTAKTLVIKAMANATGCKFSRIQFTVDLLPSDITGITTFDPQQGFSTIKGPIFANFIIADEINRAPAKTQSALLEAMQEHQVTIGRETYILEEPFFVMATQNPIETAGTYPLPEAQIDRFLFKLLLEYPSPSEEQKIIQQNVTLYKFEDYNIKPAITKQKIIEMQQAVKNIYLKENIRKYIVDIVGATRNPDEYKIKSGKYIEWGGSPRASIALYIAAKAEALLNDSTYVTPQYIKNVAGDVLRHRILLNYEGQAEGISTDDIVKEVLSKVPVP